MIRYARQTLVQRYGTTGTRIVYNFLLPFVSIVFLLYDDIYSVYQDPTRCRCANGMPRWHIRHDTTPLCLPAVTEPKICVKHASWTCFQCLPGHASNCPPTVNHRMIDDSCGLLWWSEWDLPIRSNARDRQGWRDAFIPPHHVIRGKRKTPPLLAKRDCTVYRIYTVVVQN